MADGRVIKLQTTQITQLDSLVSSHIRQREQDGIIHRSEKDRLKTKVNALWKWVAGLGALDLVLLGLLLL